MTPALLGSRMPVIHPAELSRLLAAHGPPLALLARQWCDAAEDVVQEAFVRLAEQNPPPDNPVAWLYRVVRNGGISMARAVGRRRRHEVEAGQLHAEWFEPTAADALDAELAAAALAELPVEQRETVVLRLWSGRSFEEIATLTDTSTSTAHRRYQAAIAALRQRLGADQTR